MTDTIMAFGLMQEYDQMETSITGNQDRKGFHALMMDLRKAYDSCAMTDSPNVNGIMRQAKGAQLGM